MSPCGGARSVLRGFFAALLRRELSLCTSSICPLACLQITLILSHACCLGSLIKMTLILSIKPRGNSRNSCIGAAELHAAFTLCEQFHPPAWVQLSFLPHLHWHFLQIGAFSLLLLAGKPKHSTARSQMLKSCQK